MRTGWSILIVRAVLLLVLAGGLVQGAAAGAAIDVEVPVPAGDGGTGLAADDPPGPSIPVANFTASATSGVAPCYVVFTDTSTGDGITGWSWEFGDGGTSSVASPVHKYRVPGIFTVNLTLTSAAGSDRASRTIAVAAPAPAIALELEVSQDGGVTWDDADTAPGPSIRAGKSVLWRYTVTNTGNIELAGVNLTDDRIGPVDVPGYWRIAPGESGEGLSGMTAIVGPYAHTATVTAVPWDDTAGTFLEGAAPVSASDPCHYLGTESFRADFTANATAGVAPLAVAFTDTSTGNYTSNRSWEFGDGATSAERDPVHVYAAPGTYSVNLTVTNEAGTARMPKPGYITVTAPPVTGADRGYYLVSTVPAGAAVYLEALGGTRYLQGTTSAGPLNVTICRTCTPVRKVVATLPGHLEATYTITAYPASGETVPVALALERGTDGPFPAPHVPAAVIQAEDFDAGGEGVAYHDLEPANLGRAYRPAEGVDVETANGVTNVGWVRDGEWLTYTVDTTVAGYFQLTLRAANPDPARKPVLVILDGEPSTEVVVGSTGSWTSYAEFGGVEPLPLREGRHTVTLAFEGADRLNLDWLLLAAGQAPAGGGRPYPSAHAVPGRVEAEDYDVDGFSDTTPANEGGAYRSDAVDIERGGSNHDVGWVRPGEYLQYSVDAAAPGTYAVSFRVANPGSAMSVRVLVNGGAWLLTVPATGSFGAWRTATLEGVALAAGRNTVRVETGRAGSFNLDYLEFAASAPTGIVTPTGTPAAPSGAAFTAAPLTAPRGSAVKFALAPAAGRTVRSVWWSFDAPAHLSTWNSRATNPTFFYPAAGTFSPLVRITYTDGSTETVQRTGYLRAT